jgi:hypothetical protein
MLTVCCVRSCLSKCPPFECTSIASGHAFQNVRHLNAPQVTLFKMPAIWMQLYCVRSCFSKQQPFECTSVVPGHAFQNSGHLNAALLHQVMLFKYSSSLNAPLLCQVMLFKIPTIWMLLHCTRSCFQNASHLNASLLCQIMLFKMPAIWMHLYCATICCCPSLRARLGATWSSQTKTMGQRDGITASTRCKHIQHSYSEKCVLTDRRLMNAHLAYVSGRAYVFQDYYWAHARALPVAEAEVGQSHGRRFQEIGLNPSTLPLISWTGGLRENQILTANQAYHLLRGDPILP